jgi:hypothetical protein
LTDPPLTTIRSPIQQEGADNVKILLDKITGRFTGEQQKFLPCELVIRESCGFMQNDKSLAEEKCKCVSISSSREELLAEHII